MFRQLLIYSATTVDRLWSTATISWSGWSSVDLIDVGGPTD